METFLPGLLRTRITTEVVEVEEVIEEIEVDSGTNIGEHTAVTGTGDIVEVVVVDGVTVVEEEEVGEIIDKEGVTYPPITGQ